MRAKDITTEWYFDIINPVLAEICRKNKVAVYTFGNMIHSKGNMPYSMGTARVREPRVVEACSGKAPGLPNGGSITRWFVDMGQCAKILNPKTAQTILDLAEQIDSYTYFYEIEQVHIDPFAPNSFIAIEKRLWNEARQYGLTELEYQNQGRAEAYPLCERLHEGVGVRKPTDISECAFRIELTSPYEFEETELRKLMRETTEKAIPVARKCTIPTIQSDELQVPISGTAFSITAISGREKTAVTEHIKRNGGKVATEYSPKTTVFIAKELCEEKFIKTNSDQKNYVINLVNNSLLSGLARKMLGEKVYIVQYEDFLGGAKKEEPKPETSVQDQTLNDQGELVMTMAQAEAVWTVKAGKTGYTISGYKGKDEFLHVPAYIDGMPVDTVGKGKKNQFVKKIVIPKTVQKVNTGAFPDYVNLEELVFISEKTDVSACAFTGCRLMFDENQCFVANGVLQDCLQQGDIVIPKNVRIIPEWFLTKSSIKNITSITTLNGVEKICRGAFDSHDKFGKDMGIGGDFKKLILADTVTYIGYAAFGNWPLENITIGKALKNLEYGAFEGKSVAIHYHGSKQDWYAIDKNFGSTPWDYKLESYTIHCTDGDIEHN